MRSCWQRCRNSVARSPALTVDRYGNNTPSAGRSLNRFKASVPKCTSTRMAVFLRMKLRPGDAQIEHWLAIGLVLRVQQGQGFGLVLGAQAELFAGGRVLVV